jgi:hypothetical protein
VGLDLLPDRLIAPRNRDFLEVILPGLLEDARVAMGQCCGSSTTDGGGGFTAVVDRDVSRRMEWTSRANR